MMQHQEATEPETTEVIRLAQRMYEHDRAEQERQSTLMAAAEEVGIPSEYLTKATAQLKSSRIRQSSLSPFQFRRSRKTAVLASVLALVTGTLMLFSLTYMRAEATAPTIATVVQETPRIPVLPDPSPTPSADTFRTGERKSPQNEAVVR